VLVLSPSLVRAGGIQRYTLTLLRALNELVGKGGVRCVTLPEMSNHRGTEKQRLTRWSKLRFGMQAIGEAVLWRPDLIICTHLALGPIGWLLASLGARPYWVIVYGIEAWGLLPRWKRTALRHADCVIVTSVFSREHVVKRHQLNSQRVASLPCTLDESLFGHCQDGHSTERMHGQDAHGTMLLTVARMKASERYKGHDVVLRALPSVIAKVPDLSYVVVGDGDDRPQFEILARELGVAEHVRFTGEVSDSELADLYRRSAVFALPARTVINDHDPKGEGFGIVYLEAMAFGKPVIGPNYGAPAELIRHGETGLLVDPEDPASVAEAVVSLVKNPERAREMGRAGSEFVRAHYSYETFRDRLRSMIVANHGCLRTLTARTMPGNETHIW